MKSMDWISSHKGCQRDLLPGMSPCWSCAVALLILCAPAVLRVSVCSEENGRAVGDSPMSAARLLASIPLSAHSCTRTS